MLPTKSPVKQNIDLLHLLVSVFIILFFHYDLRGQMDVEKSGTILQVALPVAAFSATLIHNDENRPFIHFSKSMATSIILTHSLKRIIDKERPNGGRHSFPSGHTSAAFTGAAFFHKRYGWRVGVPAYLLASYVGWTRVYANKHDYYDLIGGAAIGVGSAFLFTKVYEGSSNMVFHLDVSQNKYLLGFKVTI